MRDKPMLSFYKSQPKLTAETAYPAWCQYCQDNDEQPGSLSEFMGRLRRCHEAMLRGRVGRHANSIGTRVGGR